MIALTEKYRPHNLNDLIGQNHIKLGITRLLSQEKPPSVVILSGPPGSGKTSVARIMAAQMNCQADDSPCGICDSCVNVMHHAHINVIEIDAASNSGVADMRKYIETLRYPPNVGTRVLIIDEAHRMTPAAASALLTPTEQLPEFSSIILATTDINSLSGALVSRAVFQGFFNAVSDDDIIARLKYIAKEENYIVEPEVFTLIVAKSKGQVRNAINALDMCFTYTETNKVETKEVKHVLFNEHMLIYAMILCMIKGDLDTALKYEKRIKSILPSAKDIISTWLETERMIMVQALGGMSYFPDNSLHIVAENSFERVTEIWNTMSMRSQILTPDAMLSGLILIFTKPKYLIKDRSPASDADITEAFS